MKSLDVASIFLAFVFGVFVGSVVTISMARHWVAEVVYEEMETIRGVK